MRPLVAAVIVTVVIALVGAAIVVYPLGGVGSTSSSTTSGATSTSTSTPSYNGLELRLALNSSLIQPGERLGVTVSEFNTMSVENNVTKASLWAVPGLSLGACAGEEYSVYPFGIAVYQGNYTAANLSQATPLRIYPVVACPMLLRLVTGYLFQPMNDSAVILPSSDSQALTLMKANVTVSGAYTLGSPPLSDTAPQQLSPGVYTVAAGDEWGALETIHFTVADQPQGSTTSSGQQGTLSASISIGPTYPVCSANATTGPAPSPYSSLEAVVVSSSGANTTVPVEWLSNGCEVSGSFELGLSPGTYTLELSSCTFMGCSSSLPKAFSISPGQTTDVTVSVDTGIR